MRIHGDEGWEKFPSYLDVVVPRILEFLGERDLSITIFVVGKDATIDENVASLRSIADAGHEIGNHSFMHEPWLDRYSDDAIESEIDMAHRAISDATGRNPVGFRGPGYSLTPAVLKSLERRGYVYDTSTLPTFIGPVARRFYFNGADLTEAERAEREGLFGAFSDGFQANRPYEWEIDGRRLLELPVTTFPFIKVPFHFSYLLYLSNMSDRLARSYFSAGLKMCQLSRTGPTLLLHPLDFLGADDAPELAFFPGMDMDVSTKIDRLGHFVDMLTSEFDIGPVRRYATALAKTSPKIRAVRS
jgi:peptidoglycan/xylan/chitin deacetylase (PgdA/CDA1 family)